MTNQKLCQSAPSLYHFGKSEDFVRVPGEGTAPHNQPLKTATVPPVK
jgi:hypothetical protein